MAGLGIRGLVPVFQNQRHIGSVEFGMSFGQPFFDEFKKKYGVDIALHVETNGQFKTFGSTLGDKSLLTAEQLQQAMAGEAVIGRVENDGVSFATYGRVVKDFTGNPVGVMEIAQDRSHFVAAINNTRNVTLLIGGLALVVGLFIAWYIGRSITHPISSAVQAMNDIAQGEGDLTKRLDAKGRDEIAQMAEAFNRFAEKVRSIVVQVSASTAQLGAAAEQMAAVTQETTQGVQQQQSETEQVATAMNEMTVTVQEVARHATEASGAAQSADNEAHAGESLDAITRAVTTISEMNMQIANAAKEQSGVAEEINKNVVNISHVVQQTADGAQQTSASSTELARLAGELQTLVSQFKTG